MCAVGTRSRGALMSQRTPCQDEGGVSRLGTPRLGGTVGERGGESWAPGGLSSNIRLAVCEQRSWKWKRHTSETNSGASKLLQGRGGSLAAWCSVVGGHGGPCGPSRQGDRHPRAHRHPDQRTSV